MSEEINPRKLSITDPVDLDTLQKFNQLESARHDIALRFLEIEQERVRLLSAAHQVDQQHRRLFEKVLIERGLQPSTPVDIDSTTGAIKLRETKTAETEAPAEG